jgi:hypothetical protein
MKTVLSLGIALLAVGIVSLSCRRGPQEKIDPIRAGDTVPIDVPSGICYLILAGDVPGSRDYRPFTRLFKGRQVALVFMEAETAPPPFFDGVPVRTLNHAAYIGLTSTPSEIRLVKLDNGKLVAIQGDDETYEMFAHTN